jgi:hypothetical protein
MKKTYEYAFDTTTTPLSSYDSTKLSIGTLIRKNTGGGATDNWVGPNPLALGRPMEVTNGFAVGYVWAIQRTTDIAELFVADNAAAATNRRIQMWTYTLSTNTLAYVGFITMTAFAATAATIRGFRVHKYTYTTGDATISGTTVTLAGGAAIQTARFAPGRISVDSGATWYDIASINSETGLTLTLSGPTVSNVPYIIEEYRVALAVTTATTATNGSLFVCKGLHPGLFVSAGTNVAIAAATDNLRATYWLADASTILNTVSAGLSDDDATATNTNHDAYVLDGASTTAKIYKYNLRAALGSLSSGKSVSAFVLATGNQTVTGNITQTFNTVLATASHGPLSGTKAIYFVTTTRGYCVAVSNITSGNTTYLDANILTEVPPGLTSTFAASGALYSTAYIPAIDEFFIATSGATSNRFYVTKWKTDGSALDKIGGFELKQLDQSTVSAETTPSLSTLVLPFAMSVWNGVAFMVRVSTAAASNQLYAVPVSAHWTSSGTNFKRVITPSIATTDAVKFYKFYVNHAEWLGGIELGVPCESYRAYYRTSGISNNLGSWTLINAIGDLSGITPSTEIQFMFEFKVIGQSCVPTRLYNAALSYEDNLTDSHYSAAVSKSDKTLNIFAWQQRVAWGSNIPTLKIIISNLTVPGVIITDTTAANAYGTFEYSTNGTVWNAWSASADVVGNYIRYTATTLPSSIVVSAKVLIN